MKTNKLRIIIPLAILAIAGIAFAAHQSLGTLSALGWQDISVLCPIGALGTLLASKTLVPHALISLVLAVIGIVVLGRAFCGWICPVPVWRKLRYLFHKQDPSLKGKAKIDPDSPLTEKEQKALHASCGNICHARKPSDSRHIVLGAGLLSAAIFGFPVFCLICPIGLSFALVFTIILLFGGGDVTWSVVFIPVLLLVEVVFFRKWCSHVCPVGALMSLVSRANRTLRVKVDHAKCIEDTRGVKCGRCSQVCNVGINPRHPELGAGMHECTKCYACVESCPGNAITMPFLPKDNGEASVAKPVVITDNIEK